MDLVNSVTQNSNNRSTTMENQGGNGINDDDGSNGAASNQAGKAQVQQIAEAKQKTQVPDYLRAIGMDPRKFWPKKYRFTREKPPGQHNPLTIAQRNFYESNGYIVLDDCVSRRLLDQIKMSKAQRQHSVPDDSARESDFADEFLLDKLLVKNGRLTQYVKCFCDERFMLMTQRLIENFQTNELAKNMMGANGGLEGKDLNINDIESLLLSATSNNRQQLFRDWIYLPFRPIDKVVCTIVALEAIEHVILVVPGTHRVGQCTISSTLDNISAAYDSSQEKAGSAACQVSREIYESSPEKLSTLVDKSRRGFKYVNLKPGQTLFYHPGLVHGFSSDLVNFRKRQLASIAYYAAADCEFVDLRKSLSFRQQQGDENSGQAQQKEDSKVPISLAHFGDKNPRDYRSWLDKPKLVNESKANL